MESRPAPADPPGATSTSRAPPRPRAPRTHRSPPPREILHRAAQRAASKAHRSCPHRAVPPRFDLAIAPGRSVRRRGLRLEGPSVYECQIGLRVPGWIGSRDSFEALRLCLLRHERRDAAARRAAPVPESCRFRVCRDGIPSRLRRDPGALPYPVSAMGADARTRRPSTAAAATQPEAEDGCLGRAPRAAVADSQAGRAPAGSPGRDPPQP
jgi:hypothetical protein